MKQIFTLFLFGLLLNIATAQTPYTMMASHDNGQDVSALSAASLNNPWVGAGLRYNVSGDVSESFVLNARAVYSVAHGTRFNVPFVGNVGLNNPDSLGANSGVTMGVYPWYNLSGSGNLTVLLHGGLGYQILDRDDATAGDQFRIMAGLEAVFYPGDDTGAPTTLSVAPEYVTTTGSVQASTWNLNITGVLPIANGLGLLMEGAIPLEAGGYNSGFAIGVIVNSPIR